MTLAVCGEEGVGEETSFGSWVWPGKLLNSLAPGIVGWANGSGARTVLAVLSRERVSEEPD